MSDFLQTFTAEAGLDDEAEAERLAAAALGALGGRLAAAHVEELAVELPAAQAGALRRGHAAVEGAQTAGGITELAAATAEGLHSEDLDQATAAVVAALRGLVAVTDREVLDRIGGQVPRDVQELLQSEEEGDTTQLHANAPRPGQPGLA